jgi:hypothetical protein
MFEVCEEVFEGGFAPPHADRSVAERSRAETKGFGID